MLAVALHGAVLFGALQETDDPYGGGGAELEALSVEVALVPSSALESRASLATDRVASTIAVDATEGAAAASTSRVASTSPEQEPVPSQDEAQSIVPQVEPLAEPSSEPQTVALPTLALTQPDPTPPQPEAVTLPLHEPTPKRVASVEPEARPETSTSSVSAEAGGSASHAADGVQRRVRAAATASAGSIRAFTKGVVDALGKTRPKGLRSKARGTAKVAFAISEGGALEFVRVAKSSGSGVLDDAAISAVTKASFPVPPAGMTLSQRTYEVPYHFR